MLINAFRTRATFEYALGRLVDGVLDPSRQDPRFRNDEKGGSSYDPKIMFKIVLLGCSRGLISRRAIERACRDNVVSMALSGDQMPASVTIARFARELGDEVAPLFQNGLLAYDQLGLVGKEVIAIDGMKLPSNASKECSGIHAERVPMSARCDQIVVVAADVIGSGSEERALDVTIKAVRPPCLPTLKGISSSRHRGRRRPCGVTSRIVSRIRLSGTVSIRGFARLR